MKIVDAFWEKRNLGVRSTEITIEIDDTIQDLESLLSNLKNPEYVVFKIPSGGVEFLRMLTKNGFYINETLSEMCLDVENYIVPKNLARYDNKINYKMIPDKDLEQLGIELMKGIFNTDRIALDPLFGIDIAAKRYFNWIKDEVNKGNHIYEILYNENPIGFFCFKQVGENAYDNFLAGMYASRSNFGLGFSTITKSIEELKNRNGRYLITHVSSNNMSVIRLYAQIGFMLNNMCYIMTKHY